LPATIGLAATAHADAPVNFTVTDTVRAQLVEAGASLKGFLVSDFVDDHQALGLIRPVVQTQP
jgi:hypothetical protein